MTEPIRPTPRASPPERPSADGGDAVETLSTQAGTDPVDGTTARDPDPARSAGSPDPTEAVATVADGPPADVGLTRDIPAPGLGPRADGEEGATFVLPPDPNRLVDTLPDAGDGQAGRLGQVAGYEILGVLGRGAMGVVYKARQRGLRRLVALKMIGAGSHCTPTDLVRFRSEAEAVADLLHPNIVRLYEVGEDEGRPFFSLEYVEGQSLAARINGVPQPPFEAARIVKALAEAMEHAHRHGIIHRVQIAEARRQFQRGYDLVSRIAVAQPQNDVARANAGVMQLRLGELALDFDGDAARARDHFGRAWELQDEIARHPRSGQYKKVDNHRLLSGIAIKQGIAELRLGHPAAARERFERALSDRAAWVEAMPADVAALSYLSEAEVWLGVALSHLGDWPDARPHLEAAIEICHELADLHPRDLSFKGDLAVVQGDHGDALARRGRYDDAGRAYERSLDFAREVLASNRDDASQRPVLASAYERLAALAVRRGNPANAARHWSSALLIRTELAQLEPHDVPAQAALALALAHCGRCAEGTKKADELSRAAGDRPAVLLPLARCFAASAAWATESDRRRDLDRALEILGAAARGGYRDRLSLATDPAFALLRPDPRFKTLLAGMKP
jgi:tetratricopeptide (TPR) repeat protein